ncbi:MAG: exopolysaccharide biosynthesis polyprenyl glycosylphosphotransferase, partial [Alphaproteobacteria bacterium]|nr:exopolysaccharide biosynthesis polyprenyl glycosylphosphotransferase [Alphaproteobacteria bacterium]
LQVNFFHFAKLYRFDLFSNPFYQVSRLTAAWSALFLLLLAAAFLTKTSDQYSRGWALIWYSSGLAALIMLRVGLYLRIRRWAAEGRLTRNLAIVGAGAHGKRLLQHLKEQLGTDIRVVGLFDDRMAQCNRVPEVLEGYALTGSVDDLLGFARGTRVDQVIIALPWSAEERLLEIMRKLRTLPVDVRLGADMIGYHLFQSSFGHVGSVPVINLFQKPLSDWKLLAKDVEDRVLGALILLFIAPLMFVIALLIKLDSPGPVFFRQKRYGFNNQEIEVWKFRTMRPEAALDGAVPQARRNDPRVTAVGLFLRRSSLDELPQIFNVLRGDMSLVGPRPHAVLHNEQFAQVIDEYAARHRIKPGITGWAQV